MKEHFPFCLSLYFSKRVFRRKKGCAVRTCSILAYIPAHRRRPFVTGLLEHLGRSDMRSTAAPVPADTGSTVRMVPALDLKLRSQLHW